MEPNDNPPSEREWSIEEREEFFASQDAITGLSGSWPSGLGPFRPSPSIPNCGDHLAKTWFPTGIFVTSIVPPEQGWPIAMYCPICKETTFILSPWAKKPEKGDYWLIKDMCGSIEHSGQHNLRIINKI